MVRRNRAVVQRAFAARVQDHGSGVVLAGRRPIPQEACAALGLQRCQPSSPAAGAAVSPLVAHVQPPPAAGKQPHGRQKKEQGADN